MNSARATEIEIPIPADDDVVGDFVSLEVEQIPQGEGHFEADFRRC